MLQYLLVQYLCEQKYSTVLVQRKCCWVRCTYVHSPKLAKICRFFCAYPYSTSTYHHLRKCSVKQNSVQYEIIQAHLASLLSFHCVTILIGTHHQVAIAEFWWIFGAVLMRSKEFTRSFGRISGQRPRKSEGLSHTPYSS